MREYKKIYRRVLLIMWLVSFSCFVSGCEMPEELEYLKEEVRQEIDGIEEKEKEKRPKKNSSSDKEKEQKPKNVSDTEFVENPDCADNYVYSTLDREVRQVYQEVLQTIVEHKKKVAVSTLDTKVLEEAYTAVCADYGGVFWVSGYVYTQYTQGEQLIGLDFQPKYTMEYEQREEIQKQIDASAAELMAGISMTDTDYDKAKYVFEILVQNVDYDANIENNQNIISTFLSRATVCQGYACATQYLLQRMGIQSAIVTGTARGESHAWNLICLNGKYYYMDTTWGNSRYLDASSQAEKYVNYNYLAVTTEEITKTHQFSGNYPLPECTSMEDSYFVKENRYFTEWNPQEIGAKLTEMWNVGASEVAVKFSSLELYRYALQYFVTEQHIAEYCENITAIYYLEDEELCVLTFKFHQQ